MNNTHLSTYKTYFTIYANETFNYIFNLLTCFPAADRYEGGFVVELEGERGFIPCGLYDFKDPIPDEANKRFMVEGSKEKIPDAYKLNLGELKKKKREALKRKKAKIKKIGMGEYNKRLKKTLERDNQIEIVNVFSYDDTKKCAKIPVAEVFKKIDK